MLWLRTHYQPAAIQHTYGCCTLACKWLISGLSGPASGYNVLKHNAARVTCSSGHKKTVPLDVLSDAANGGQAVNGLVNHELGCCALGQHSAQVHDASVFTQAGGRPAGRLDSQLPMVMY